MTIYHGDSLEIAPKIKADSVVADPPYGIAWKSNQRFSGGNSRRGAGTKHRLIARDDEPFDPTPWLSYENVILWGANHFWGSLPRGSALVWLKRNDHALGSFLSDAEIAYFSSGSGVYVYRHVFAGSQRALEAGRGPYAGSAHSTQKPVGLMSWCLGKLKNPGVVLDPFMGSGTTLVAARDLGIECVGIDIDEKHCETAKQRLLQGGLPFTQE